MRLGLLLALPLLLLGADLKELLRQYKKEQELSQITKKETSGLLTLFDSARLEAMQAYTLEDVLKNIPLLHLTRTPNNLSIFTLASSSYVSPSTIRLYINDHDVTSASFGSAILIWGNMPIEYIDHIEVYRGASSIEFGNESGTIIIKVYTKLATREVGRKLRTTIDHRGSRGIDFYNATLLDEKSDLFFYGHYYKFKPKITYNDGYRIDRGREENLFYLNYHNANHTLELSNINKQERPFLGYGIAYHPTGGGLDANHFYLNYTYSPDESTSLNLAYDRLSYDRIYEDESGIPTTVGLVHFYHTRYEDRIYSVIANKRLYFQNSSLYLGGFVKKKEFSKKGQYDSLYGTTKNFLYLYSIYADYRYDFSPSTAILLSAKLDLYRYHKRVKDRNERVLRLALIRHFDRLRARLYATSTYTPIPFYKLCTCDNIAYNANPLLKNPSVEIAGINIEFPYQNASFYINMGKKWVRNALTFSPQTFSYTNDPATHALDRCEVGGEIRKEDMNLRFSFYWAKNSQDLHLSPSHGATIEAIHNFDRITLYQELLYKGRYNYFGTVIDDSFEYTFAIKYFLGQDFSIGFRAQNLFDDAMQQKYIFAERPFAVRDRRYLINMEYRF